VKILATGVCHTDYSEPRNYPTMVDGEFVPVILGHEGGGIVESVGEGVTSLAPGDHVIPLYIPECRDCVYCLSQKTNLCGKIRGTQGKGVMPDGTSRFTCKGKTLYHFMGTSTFSEYTVCAEISLAKVSPLAPLDKVCLLGCGITTGYGAVLNTMKCEAGCTSAVFGLGGVGLAAIMGLKESGARMIIGVDINPAKFELARAFGATHIINPKELPEGTTTGAAICALVGDYAGAGVDYSFECIGNVNTMRQAFECVHKGWGQSCVIGVGPPGQEISTRPFQVVIARPDSAELGWFSSNTAHYTAFHSYGLNAHACALLCLISTGQGLARDRVRRHARPHAAAALRRQVPRGHREGGRIRLVQPQARGHQRVVPPHARRQGHPLGRDPAARGRRRRGRAPCEFRSAGHARGVALMSSVETCNSDTPDRC